MKVEFIVKGDPFGWQRAGQNRKTKAVYTQEKTRIHEQIVALSYKAAAEGFSFPKGTYICLRVYAYMRIPKSTSKKKRELMLSGQIRPTVKPDWDNLGKLVSDALNGVAYDDDKYVVDAVVRKFYSATPATKVIVEEVK